MLVLVGFLVCDAQASYREHPKFPAQIWKLSLSKVGVSQHGSRTLVLSKGSKRKSNPSRVAVTFLIELPGTATDLCDDFASQIPSVNCWFILISRLAHCPLTENPPGHAFAGPRSRCHLPAPGRIWGLGCGFRWVHIGAGRMCGGDMSRTTCLTEPD